MKIDLFQSCGDCWVFHICWHIECSTFTASSLRIWNSSTGIPSHPLALFIVMLPKAHLTSHSRMSSSRWAITPSWLSGSWRSILYSFYMYSCPLFLISSAFVRLILFLSVRDLPSDMSITCLRFNDSNKLESFSESTFQRKTLKDSCLSRFPEPFDNRREYGISQLSDSFHGSLKPTTVLWFNTQN